MEEKLEALIAAQTELVQAIREQSRMLDQLSGAIIDLVQEVIEAHDAEEQPGQGFLDRT